MSISRPVLALALGFLSCTAGSAAAAEWDPATFAGENTLELKTTAAGEGEHWFPVWLVVVDDQVYVRLGTRAAGRIERNTTAPYVGVRIGGREFDRVKAIAMPDKTAAVAQAMGRNTGATSSSGTSIIR